MKKILSLFLAIVICGICIVPANAESEMLHTDNSGTVVVYEDGSSLTISPIQYIEINSRATASTQDAYRTYTYKNSSDEIEWEFILNATFSYVYGSSVTCTDTSYDYTIYKDSWKFSDGSTSSSGGTAYGYGTFKNKFLLITTKTINVEAEITCDVYGNLS